MVEVARQGRLWYGKSMIKILEQAIEKVKARSPERQEYAAEVLEQIADSGDEIYHLSGNCSPLRGSVTRVGGIECGPRS